MAEKQSKSRGWLTYTELDLLFPQCDFIKEYILHNIVLAFSYTIGVITIISAFQIASLVPGNSLYSKSLVNSKLDSVKCTATNNNLIYNNTSDHALIDGNSNETINNSSCDNLYLTLDDNFSENSIELYFNNINNDNSNINIFVSDFNIEKEIILSSKMSKQNIVDYITQDNNIVALQNYNKKYNFVTNFKYYF